MVALFCLINPIDNVTALTVNTSKTAECSEETVYKQLIVGLLTPKIDEAVDNYYKKYFKHTPGTVPFLVDVLSVDSEKSDERLAYPSSFKVKVQVSPYFGPHNSVGTDNITFNIGVCGDVKVEKFEHIRSYELPWNYQNEIINVWPPN